MSLLNWGQPTIEISKLDESGKPTTWTKVDNPVKDTTNLDTQEGEVQEAEGEGGELVDIKVGKNKYTFNFELFVKKGVALPVEDVDGKVEGFYAMRLTPEDETCEGIQFEKSVITAKDTYTAKDGQHKPYVMRVLNAKEGKTIKPYTKGGGA